jgi:hypothetical protein
MSQNLTCTSTVVFDDRELIEAYIGLNNDSGTLFQVSNLLPSVNTTQLSRSLLVICQRRTMLKQALMTLRRILVHVTDVAGITHRWLINVSVGITNGLYDTTAVRPSNDNHFRGTPERLGVH